MWDKQERGTNEELSTMFVVSSTGAGGQKVRRLEKEPKEDWGKEK